MTSYLEEENNKLRDHMFDLHTTIVNLEEENRKLKAERIIAWVITAGISLAMVIVAL